MRGERDRRRTMSVGAVTRYERLPAPNVLYSASTVVPASACGATESAAILGTAPRSAPAIAMAATPATTLAPAMKYGNAAVWAAAAPPPRRGSERRRRRLRRSRDGTSRSRSARAERSSSRPRAARLQEKPDARARRRRRRRAPTYDRRVRLGTIDDPKAVQRDAAPAIEALELEVGRDAARCRLHRGARAKAGWLRHPLRTLYRQRRGCRLDCGAQFETTIFDGSTCDRMARQTNGRKNLKGYVTVTVTRQPGRMRSGAAGVPPDWQCTVI